MVQYRMRDRREPVAKKQKQGTGKKTKWAGESQSFYWMGKVARMNEGLKKTAI